VRVASARGVGDELGSAVRRGVAAFVDEGFRLGGDEAGIDGEAGVGEGEGGLGHWWDGLVEVNVNVNVVESENKLNTKMQLRI
jgi:hypothetical protein